MFADDMILYKETPNDTTNKLLELTNEFGKVSGYKLIHRNVLISWMLIMKDKKRNSETILYTIISKKKKKLPRNKPT